MSSEFIKESVNNVFHSTTGLHCTEVLSTSNGRIFTCFDDAIMHVEGVDVFHGKPLPDKTISVWIRSDDNKPVLIKKIDHASQTKHEALDAAITLLTIAYPEFKEVGSAGWDMCATLNALREEYKTSRTFNETLQHCFNQIESVNVNNN